MTPDDRTTYEAAVPTRGRTRKEKLQRMQTVVNRPIVTQMQTTQKIFSAALFNCARLVLTLVWNVLRVEKKLTMHFSEVNRDSKSQKSPVW